MQETPLQTLTISKSSDDTATVVSRRDADGFQIALYVVHQNSSKSRMEIRYADGHPSRQLQQQQAGREPIAAVAFHFFSSTIDITLHGVDLKMKRKNPLGGHSFSHQGLNRQEEMQWKESSLLGGGMRLVHSRGRTMAVYKKRLGGSLNGGESGFQIYDCVEDNLFMDVIVVTGLAAAEYKRQSNNDWEWLEEMI